ncbi:MAG: hypothetical protein K0S76_475 [Herbinix sp.]|jgi:hypothetical protein|nr:hypothetical protein [Herbinix sp.]
MNDLQIVVKQQQGVISTNFDEIKEALTSQMEVYKELAVTEENKTERKKDIATLRKIIKAVSDKRIEVKKECLKPYDLFEKQANELVDIINEPVKMIDSRVKEFEDKQRLEKIAAIKNIFAELIGDLVDVISFEKIYDSKWESATTSMKSIKDEIAEKLTIISGSIISIKSMQSEKVEEALNRYYENLDFMGAINFINRHEQQRREIEQRMIEQQKIEREKEAEQERERIRREEREIIAREERIKAEATAKAEHEQRTKELQEQQAMAVKKQSSVQSDYVYGISATEEEIEQIEMYLNSLGVEFERIG